MEHSEWVMVPKDAIERAIETLENDGDEHGEGRNLRAMLDAAPPPPAEAQPVGKVSKDTGLTVTLERLPYYTGTRLAKGTELYAHPPPSAPVGVEKVTVPADVMEARAQGRSEALAILLELDAEEGLDDYTTTHALGDTGDYTSRWDEKKLRELFRADDTAWSLLQEAEGEYWHNLGLREEAQRLAQQPAAVSETMVERIAALLHEEATDEPWAVAGVEHDGPDRDYYRTLAHKVIVRAAQQGGAE